MLLCTLLRPEASKDHCRWSIGAQSVTLSLVLIAHLCVGEEGRLGEPPHLSSFAHCSIFLFAFMVVSASFHLRAEHFHIAVLPEVLFLMTMAAQLVRGRSSTRAQLDEGGRSGGGAARRGQPRRRWRSSTRAQLDEGGRSGGGATRRGRSSTRAAVAAAQLDERRRRRPHILPEGFGVGRVARQA